MAYDVVEDRNDIADRTETDGIELAILCLAQSVNHLAYQVRELGNGDAATQMGAIEALGKVIKEGLEELSGAITSAND